MEFQSQRKKVKKPSLSVSDGRVIFVDFVVCGVAVETVVVVIEYAGFIRCDGFATVVEVVEIVCVEIVAADVIFNAGVSINVDVLDHLELRVCVPVVSNDAVCIFVVSKGDVVVVVTIVNVVGIDATNADVAGVVAVADGDFVVAFTCFEVEIIFVDGNTGIDVNELDLSNTMGNTLQLFEFEYTLNNSIVSECMQTYLILEGDQRRTELAKCMDKILL